MADQRDCQSGAPGRHRPALELEHEAIGLLTERSLPAHRTFLTGTPAGGAFEPPTDDFIDRARQQDLLEAASPAA